MNNNDQALTEMILDEEIDQEIGENSFTVVGSNEEGNAGYQLKNKRATLYMLLKPEVL
ncbi:hypothetical protein [Sutcliffiella rhizosphaerae]|uniref:hypothetical protein n=1 Tax=Sutcliffiella rhizosphaerae TaxID=2880967 RepID=UPI001E5FB8A4|nr:hypothetical protein [Sutcliffiella rhizosphaerae]